MLPLEGHVALWVYHYTGEKVRELACGVVRGTNTCLLQSIKRFSVPESEWVLGEQYASYEHHTRAAAAANRKGLPLRDCKHAILIGAGSLA